MHFSTRLHPQARRGRPHRGHRAGGRRRRRGAVRPARQGRRHHRRPGRLHRQRAAVRLPQPRGRRCSSRTTPRARTSTPRCGSAAAYPMGPLALLDLIGLDTAYEILDTMYRQCATGCTRRRRSSSRWSPPACCGRKTGRGFYTYEAPDSPDRRGRRADPAPTARTTARAAAGQQVGVVGSGHDGDRHRRGLRQGRATTCSSSPAARRRSTGSAPALERSLDKAVQRGKLDRGRPRRGARPGHRYAPARRPGRPRPGGRGRRRGAARSSRRCSRTSTRSASRARCWPRRPRRCR